MPDYEEIQMMFREYREVVLDVSRAIDVQARQIENLSQKIAILEHVILNINDMVNTLSDKAEFFLPGKRMEN